MKKQLAIIMLILLIPLTYALAFPKETVFFDKLVANNEQTKLVKNEDILITKFGISANTNISRARITIQTMPDCPENAPYQENVLQCFYISGFEMSDNQISSTKISFKVPKEWMNANNYDKIELRRYSYSWNENVHGKLSEWQPLLTKLENEKYNEYLAYSDGMNYFSIVGIKKEIIIPVLKEVSIPTITANAIKIVPRITTSSVKTLSENKKDLNLSWLPSLFLSLTMLLVIFTPKFEKETSFEQLTNYIKNSNDSEHKIKHDLKSNGWEN